MIDYAELNKLTILTDHIDSEMTRIYNKVIEFEDLIEKFTDTEDERFASILNSRRKLYMREYNLLSIDLAKLVEKRRGVLDKYVEDLIKPKLEEGYVPTEWTPSPEDIITDEKEKQNTKFTYDDYLKMSKEEQENIGKKEWHDLSPEERMLILEDWGFGDDIKDYKKVIRDKKDMDSLTKKEKWSVYDYQRFEELI